MPIDEVAAREGARQIAATAPTVEEITANMPAIVEVMRQAAITIPHNEE